MNLRSLRVSNIIMSSLCYEGIANRHFFIYSGLSLCNAREMNLVLVERAGCELSVFLLMVSVFSTALSLCLLSPCCAVILKMNHLPLGAHCFWPNDRVHQRWSYTSCKPLLDPPSSLPLPSFSEFAPDGPSLVGKWITPPVRRSKANVHFWTGTHTHRHMHACSGARVRALCIGNTETHTVVGRKDEIMDGSKCICSGEQVINTSRFLHTCSCKCHSWAKKNVIHFCDTSETIGSCTVHLR